MAFEQVLYRLYREVAGGNAFIGNVALANTGTFQNPLVGGLDHFSRSLLLKTRGGT